MRIRSAGTRPGGGSGRAATAAPSPSAAQQRVQAAEEAHEKDGQLAFLARGIERTLVEAGDGGRADAEDHGQVLRGRPRSGRAQGGAGEDDVRRGASTPRRGRGPPLPDARRKGRSFQLTIIGSMASIARDRLGQRELPRASARRHRRARGRMGQEAGHDEARYVGKGVGTNPSSARAREGSAATPFSGRWMSMLDPSRARAELGFVPTPLPTYLASIVASFLAHPPPARRMPMRDVRGSSRWPRRLLCN